MNENDAMSDFPIFLERAVEQIVSHEDQDAFFEWMRETAPQAFPNVFADVPEDDRTGFAFSLGRAVWNETPLPSNEFRPQPVPKPGRNDICPCGVGRKFKRCCAKLFTQVPEIDSVEIWKLFVLQIDEETLEELSEHPRLAPGMMAEVGRRLLDAGYAAPSAFFLEPLFHHPEKLDLRAADALEVFLDALDIHANSSVRDTIVDALGQRLKPPLSATLWWQKALNEANDGRFLEAWESLAKGQEADPDDPQYYLAEVNLLALEGRRDEASEKARFWAGQLRKHGVEQEVISYLDAVAVDSDKALLQTEDNTVNESVLRLQGVLAGLAERQPEAHEIAEHDLEDFADIVPGDLPTGQLQAPEAVQKAEEAWAKAFPLQGLEQEGSDQPEMEIVDSDEADWDAWESEDDEEDRDCWRDRADAWLSILEEQPAALDSFEVLADVNRALEQLPFAPTVKDRLFLGPILDHGQRLAQAIPNLDQHRLLWASPGNQPCLRLLFEQAGYRMRARDQAGWASALAEALRIAPDDILGFRRDLLTYYLANDQNEEALALADVYAAKDELPDTSYGRVLALFRLGRQDDATLALNHARQGWPKIAELISEALDDRPTPFPDEEDEATFRALEYVDENIELWLTTSGAAEWVSENLREDQ